MKTRSTNWHRLVLSFLMLSVFAYAGPFSNGIAVAQNSLERTRLELHEQGFKTDLTNFDFSTSPEMRARQAILEATVPNRRTTAFEDHPNLMEPTSSNEVVVVWKQNVLRRQSLSWPATSYELTWDDFHDAINQNQSQIDAASAAILSGPIQFNLDAAGGNYMLLPHLALLKNLTQILNDRAVLALHDGNRDAAWTNLLAATRLVTAWNPEPAEVSHHVRFDNARLVFNASWQALQTNGWTDDQLTGLQHEWESANFLNGLPEIQAFRRASDLQMLEQDGVSSQNTEAEMQEDEANLLLFYRGREIEFRNAVQAATWTQMRQMPGVTNEIFFEPKHRVRGRFEISLQQRRMRMRFEGQGISFLARAAEAEAERRVIVTAIALERFRGKHGQYPQTLQALAPEFLKSVPVDFMTGQPLHYRVADNGNFLLYSVGLDCVDNGGKVQTPPNEQERSAKFTNPNTPVPESDIVWPLAASPAQVVALRKRQGEEFAKQMAAVEAREKAAEMEGEQLRQAAMKKFLADNRSLGEEPVYQGKPLSVWVVKLGSDELHGAPKDAIAAIRVIGPKAVPFLLAWMPHPDAKRPVEGLPDWSDVEIAWWALGTDGKSAIPALARLINRPQHTMDDYSVWTESAKAISYLGPDAIVPMLAAATNNTGQHEMWELLHNFENLGTNGAPAVPALIHWANDPDSLVRAGVVNALGGIGQRPDLAVPVLTNALQDSDWMVRRDAGEALGSFAKDSDAVLPLLIATVKDPADWHARGGALSGLGKIHDKPEVVVPVIAPYLYDENNVIQRTAAYALRDLGSEAGYRVLLQASNAPSSWPGIGDIIYEVQEKSHHDNSQ
jgi:hypothetical protein